MIHNWLREIWGNSMHKSTLVCPLFKNYTIFLAQYFQCTWHTFYSAGRVNLHTTLKGGSPVNLEFKGLVGGGVATVLKQWQWAPPTTQLTYLTSFLEKKWSTCTVWWACHHWLAKERSTRQKFPVFAYNVALSDLFNLLFFLCTWKRLGRLEMRLNLAIHNIDCNTMYRTSRLNVTPSSNSSSEQKLAIFFNNYKLGCIN